jgi:hypothetical protein
VKKSLSPPHPHMYAAINQRRKQYKCVVVNCTHLMAATHMEGRQAKCHFCPKTFTVTKDHLRRARISCIGCGLFIRQSKKERLAPRRAADDLETPLMDILDRVAL